MPYPTAMGQSTLQIYHCHLLPPHPQAHTSLFSSLKVLGSMLGKSLTATGSKNSMKGTSRNTRNGTRRNMSAVVRTNWNINRSMVKKVSLCVTRNKLSFMNNQDNT